MRLSKIECAYLAGFLDGDGSIYIQLKRNETYKYKFQIAANVVFYQSSKEKRFMYRLQEKLGIGHIRERTDKMIEYIIGDQEAILEILNYLNPYLKIKTRQAKLTLEIMELKKNINSVEDFLRIVRKIDLFKDLNYSKRRRNNYLLVRSILKEKGLLTP